MSTKLTRNPISTVLAFLEQKVDKKDKAKIVINKIVSIYITLILLVPRIFT